MPVARSALQNALTLGQTSFYFDATEATIEDPLIAGGRFRESLDVTNFPYGGRIATMSSGPKGIVGSLGTNFNDDVTVVVGEHYINQAVWATIYNSGLDLGNYEHELHTHSYSTGDGNQSCYALAMVILNSVQLGKWTGPFKTIGGNNGPIILSNAAAIPGGVLVTGDQIGIISTGTPSLMRVRCVVRRLGVSGTYLDTVVGDDVIHDFLDDGTNDGSLGGDAPSNRNPSSDSVSTDNTPPLVLGNPGLGFDNSASNYLRAGFTDYRAYTWRGGA